MLNIIFVGTLPPHPGGAAISCGELLTGFVRRGHRVRALAPVTPDTSRGGDEFVDAEPRIELTRVVVPYFHTDPNVTAPVSYRRQERQQIRARLSTLLQRERSDVVLIGRAIYVFDVPDMAAAHAVPCVLRSAGATTLGIHRSLFPPPLARRLLAQYQKMSLIISPAAHLTETLVELGCQRVRTIPNAVDLERFSPGLPNPILRQRLDIRDDDIVVVHASNMKMLKRPLDIVEAAAHTVRRNPRLVYVILGDGPLRATMEQACQKHRIAERFRFVGWVDYPAVPDYINLADMVVMPSEAEGLARVYLETLACGRLLIASAIPAAREVVIDGETGLLFRKGDIHDQAAKILLAGGDGTLRAKIGRRGYARVRANGMDGALAAYVSALEEVVERSRVPIPTRSERPPGRDHLSDHQIL